MTDKIVLCRPHGGLNDTLCQIQHCFAYCRKFNRRLILDTSRSGLHDNFLRYFEFTDSSVRVDDWQAFKAESDTSSATVLPNISPDLLDTYEVELGECGVYFDIDTMTPLSFDRAKDHPQDILIHEACGGGINSYWLLKYLTPTDFLISELRNRLSHLPSPYIGIHIRNTDLETDHIKLLNDLDYAISGQGVLFCTDSGKLQADLKAGDGHTASAHFVAELDPISSDPLHGVESTNTDSNLAMFADLVALSQSRKLFFSFTKEGRISGFSGLAYALHCSKLKRKFKAASAGGKTSGASTMSKKGSFLRYTKSQVPILAAKLFVRIGVFFNEAWPNR